MRACHAWPALRAAAQPTQSARTITTRASDILRPAVGVRSSAGTATIGLGPSRWRIEASRAARSPSFVASGPLPRLASLRTLATRARSPTHARRKRNRTFLALGIVLGLGVAAYWIVPPFQLFVLAVQRCSRIGIAVICDIIDYKLLFRKSVDADRDGSDGPDRGLARRRRTRSADDWRGRSGTRTLRTRTDAAPSASSPFSRPTAVST